MYTGVPASWLLSLSIERILINPGVNMDESFDPPILSDLQPYKVKVSPASLSEIILGFITCAIMQYTENDLPISESERNISVKMTSEIQEIWNNSAIDYDLYPNSEAIQTLETFLLNSAEALATFP